MTDPALLVSCAVLCAIDVLLIAWIVARRTIWKPEVVWGQGETEDK